MSCHPCCPGEDQGVLWQVGVSKVMNSDTSYMFYRAFCSICGTNTGIRKYKKRLMENVLTYEKFAEERKDNQVRNSS